MPIAVECNQCQSRFGAPDHLAGKSVRCPTCSATISIPGTAAGPKTAPSSQTTTKGTRPQAVGPGTRPQGAKPGGWGAATHQPAAKSSTGLIIGIVVGVGALLMLAIGAIVVVVVMNGSGDVEVAQNDSSNQMMAPETSEHTDSTASSPASGSSAGLGISAAPVPSSQGSSSESPSNSGSEQGAGITRPTPSGNFGAPVDGSSPTDSSDSESTGATRPPRNNSDRGTASSGSSTGQPSIVSGMDQWWNRSEKNEGSIDVEEMDLAIYHYSWLTEVLPFIGHAELHDKLDLSKPFNRTVPNIEVAHELIPQFLNPADSRVRFEGHYFEGLGLTHFVGMSGVENTRNTTAALLPRTDDRAGIFGYDSVAQPSEVTDGLSNTIMIIGSGMASGPWISGGGHSVRGARSPHFDSFTGFGSKGVDDGGAIVVMADGSVRIVTAEISDDVFRAMCTIHGGETVDVESSTKPSTDWSTRRRRNLE